MGAILSLLWSYYAYVFPGNLPKIPLAVAGTSTQIVEGPVCKVNDLEIGQLKEFDLGGKKILVAREKDGFLATGSKCTHAGAPLKNGTYLNGRIRCPWHGACFDVATGDIEDMPGIHKLPCFQTQVKGNDVFVRAPMDQLANSLVEAPLAKRDFSNKKVFVLVGGGPAASAAAFTLRTEGFSGRIIMYSKEKLLPYNRPKLSKIMNIDAEKALIYPKSFYESGDIEVKLGVSVTELDPSTKTITASNGDKLNPQRLSFIPGTDAKNVYVLRTIDEAHTIFDVYEGKNIVVIGSSFIGMETAACLVKKAASVVVVGMEKVPFERVLGEEIGAIMQEFHELKGVQFRMNAITSEIKVVGGEAVHVLLKDGEVLPCDIVVIGAGVVPNTSFLKLTEDSKLQLSRDKAVSVDECMWTGEEGLFAVGDLARYPYKWLPGETVRIEHYGMAQTQAMVAARNMINGESSEKVTQVPFFWTAQYGASLRYSGHALHYDSVIFDDGGKKVSPKKPVFVAFYVYKGSVHAVAAMNRDPAVTRFAEILNAGGSVSEKQVRDALKKDGTTDNLLEKLLQKGKK